VRPVFPFFRENAFFVDLLQSYKEKISSRPLLPAYSSNYPSLHPFSAVLFSPKAAPLFTDTLDEKETKKNTVLSYLHNVLKIRSLQSVFQTLSFCMSFS
jgi:hypothetical protein